MTETATIPENPTGEEVLALFAAAARHLRESAAAVDAINVYPVPDGDTGSNMAATLEEAVLRAADVPMPRALSDVATELAKGALYGARGNSGVILSQALKGFAAGLEGHPALDGDALRAAFTAAAERAYAAVSKPVKGTMLTVLRAAADGASTGHAGGMQTLAAAVAAAETAEARTPEQLPALAEAGVTDAGGEGVCVILRGLLAAWRGELAAVRAPRALPRLAMGAGHETERFGFCTEFLVESDAVPVDLEALRALAGGGGNRSVVVVGDHEAAHVHLHTDHPEDVLAAAAALGRVSRAKVEDMSAQNVRFEASGSGAGARVALLALSPGQGFDAIFGGLGASVAHLGDTTKPSAGDIAKAADALRTADVIVLPNHKNVVWAANQAVGLASCTLHVVPSESLPQGIAAAMAFDAGARWDDNCSAMNEALPAIRTVEVTTAAADRTAEGIAVRKGQAIVLVDDTLVAASGDSREALFTGLRSAGAGDASLVTIYTAAGTTLAEDDRALRAAVGRSEVQVLSGGQTLYTFIASVE